MIRYVRQQDDFRCGPIAILNALKWAYPYRSIGHSKSRNLKSLCIMCKTDRQGTIPDEFHTALKDFFPYVRRILKPTITQINRHLDNDRPLILGHSYIKDDGIYE